MGVGSQRTEQAKIDGIPGEPRGCKWYQCNLFTLRYSSMAERFLVSTKRQMKGMPSSFACSSTALSRPDATPRRRKPSETAISVT